MRDEGYGTREAIELHLSSRTGHGGGRRGRRNASGRRIHHRGEAGLGTRHWMERNTTLYCIIIIVIIIITIVIS